MSLIILNVDEVRRTLSASGGAFVVHDKEVDIVRFAINSGFADIVLDEHSALRVMYQRPGETQVRAQTLAYYDTDGIHNFYDWELLAADLESKGTLVVALCVLRADTEVEEWHTTPCQVRVLDTIHTDDSDEGDETITPTAIERIAVLEATVDRLKNISSGVPQAVGDISEMTDASKIYVLSTDGKWYWYDGSTWVEGGVYGSAVTDTSLSITGAPADSKEVGDRISALQIKLLAVGDDLNAAEAMINLNSGRVKNVPIDRSGTVDGLSVSYAYGKVTLNGTPENNLIIEADSDRITDDRDDRDFIAYRRGFTSGFFDDVAISRKIPITPGTYRFVFNMVSGSVTKNGITYTSNKDFGSVNVVNAFLTKADATSSSYTIKKTNVTTEIELEVTQIGLQVLYCYSGCSFDNAIFELYLEKVEEESIIDDTLSIEGKAADAKATGDAIAKAVDDISDLEENTIDAEVRINANSGKVKNVPLARSGTVSELSVEYRYGKIVLNGAITENKVLEADSDITALTGSAPIPYRNGFTSGLFEDNTAARKIPITPGRYRFVFNMLSGSVTKGGVTYTSNKDFGTTNIVNAFLLKADATESSYTIKKTNVTTGIDLEVTQIGLQVLFCYAGCTFNNAVFELYLEKAEESLPGYWLDEINTSIATIQENVMSASASNSSTLCFITDLHWAENQHRSPEIVKKLFGKCNINYFVCGGDLIERHHTTKAAAIAELTACIDAFRNVGKPMITLYGNHDRNRNNNSDDSTYLTKAEHVNLVFKSFMTHVKRLANDYDSFYWEDDIYRYVCLYWYYSDSHALSYMAEMFNTSKPVVVFCHGIYFTLAADPEEDVVDNGWILGALEPYKTQIRCIIQGHTHRDGLRWAWETVPVIVIDCDKTSQTIPSTPGTIFEQSVSVITIDMSSIKVVKVGRGSDFTVTADSAPWRQEYDSDGGETA